MKKLYKKIYEAINTGIQKALVLDDEDDISMNYQYKKIANDVNLISYYVDELLQDPGIEYNYEQIIKYYEETGYKYKVKDFNELKNIFNIIKDIENVSWEWVENMKDYISIVLEDDTEIYFNEKTDKKALFLKFANDDILNTENEILIYLNRNHYIIKKYKWQTKYISIQDEKILIKNRNIAEKDYSGYENCLKIQDIVSGNFDTYGEIPAISYCLNQEVNGHQGYLPSIGQLKAISDNLNMINYVLSYLKLNRIYLNTNNWCWWSSTEYSKCHSWDLSNGNIYYEGKVYDNNKVLPLFTCMKKI
ncbi:MAG: hypothetical protein [Wendovervirus sonii]|uniref:Uncharacterized protein n=1 Tax=phage Lak_Megaphage_Sonny TaxID=3109229 RepID=A0ABZ0Z3V7_9CAUD|nr:MAG: hypothetical protein [phage Lak_Megaphage_Sonny]